MITRRSLLLAIPLAAITPPSRADVYLTVEQARRLIFPRSNFHRIALALTQAQRDVLRERSGVHEPFREDRIWATDAGDFFVVDEVVGKHEMITYAVGIDRGGSVKQVEILEYHETYGSEIRDTAWRKQFVGKTAASALKLNRDIANISGATLSSKHVTDGVRRVLILHEMVLKGLPLAGG